jgi:hypothetical protein
MFRHLFPLVAVLPAMGCHLVLPYEENRRDDAVADGLRGEGNCPSGATRDCYSGPPSTLGIGECKSGTQTCAGTGWGDCSGEVLPTQEVCDNTDNNCNGVIDEEWTNCGTNGPTSNFSCSGSALRQEQVTWSCLAGACTSSSTWVVEKDCGSGSNNNCSAWSAFTCSGNLRIRTRVCYKNSCETNACVSTAWTDTDSTDCSSDSCDVSSTTCCCKGNEEWCARPCLKGSCSNGQCVTSPYTTTWRAYYACGAPLSPCS